MNQTTFAVPIMETETGIIYKITCCYKSIETVFEKMSNILFRLFSNPLMFMAAVGLVVVWFSLHDWSNATASNTIRDIILGITFINFFIIQRTYTHFSRAMHLKLNELVAANDGARNHIIKAEQVSGAEMKEMAKAHDQIIAEEDAPPPPKIISI